MVKVRDAGLAIRTLPVFTQSLWSWNDLNEGISRRIVYGMKGHSDPETWRPLAATFLSLTLSHPKDACLIPMPSKRSSEGDHAFGFASALHELTGLPIEACLFSPPQPHQRSQSRLERRKIRIIKKKRLSKVYGGYILVDDVITSGATLQAAYKALKRPAGTQAWCLMDRRLLRFSVLK